MCICTGNFRVCAQKRNIKIINFAFEWNSTVYEKAAVPQNYIKLDSVQMDLFKRSLELNFK